MPFKKVKLKRRPKPAKAKAPPTPESSVTVGASVPFHIAARLRAFAEIHDATIGSVVAVALDKYLPHLAAE